jgi:hypothetical protein
LTSQSDERFQNVTKLPNAKEVATSVDKGAQIIIEG